MSDGNALVPVEGHAELGALEQLGADRDPRLVYLASLSTPKSRRAMEGALERVAGTGGCTAETMPWHLLRYQHVQAIRSRLEVSRFSPATINQALAALRGVLREAARLGLISAEDLARAIDVRGAKGSRVPRGRALARDELRALIGACDVGSSAGARDAALVAIAYTCGLRRAELVGLDLADVAGDELRVRGKGNRERIAYMTPALEHLNRWLARRGEHEGPLFLPVDRHDRIVWRRLSDQAVLFVLHRLATRAGLEAFSPHDMRRTFIGDLLDAGADISTVQGLAGHAQVTTTQRYDRRGERVRRGAAALLKI